MPNDDKEAYDPEAILILTKEKYEKLSCLSLNQLDIPVNKPWLMNELHERISQEFEKLADSSIMNLAAKTQVVYSTFRILTQRKMVTSIQ